MTPAPGDEVWLTRRKYPNGPHYEGVALVLGDDEHGTWVGAPVGARVILPDRSERTGWYEFVTCVPRDQWFVAHFWQDHPEVAIYVDICTPAVWSDERITVIDLDFDVIRWNAQKGGGVELVDEDEFEQHRVALGYPVDMQDNARRAAVEVTARVERGEPPFTAACATPWLEALRAQSS